MKIISTKYYEHEPKEFPDADLMQKVIEMDLPENAIILDYNLHGVYSQETGKIKYQLKVQWEYNA